MSKFKDQCEECKTWDICHGYEGKVLCEKCIEKHEEEKKNGNQSEETIREQPNT